MSRGLAAVVDQLKKEADALLISFGQSLKYERKRPTLRYIGDEEFQIKVESSDKRGKRRRDSVGSSHISKKRKLADILATLRSLPADRQVEAGVVDELEEKWGAVTKRYELSSQSLERILEKSGGVEAEAQRRIGSLQDDIASIKTTIESTREKVADTVNTVDDSAYGEERRVQTVKALANKLKERGVRISMPAMDATAGREDQVVGAFKKVLAKARAKLKAQMDVQAAQQLKVEEERREVEEVVARKEEMLRSIEEVKAEIESIQEEKEEKMRQSSSADRPLADVKVIHNVEGLVTAMLEKEKGVTGVLLSCLIEAGGAMPMSQLKAEVKEKGYSSVECTKGIYEMEGKALLSLQRGRPTIVQLV